MINKKETMYFTKQGKIKQLQAPLHLKHYIVSLYPKRLLCLWFPEFLKVAPMG